MRHTLNLIKYQNVTNVFQLVPVSKKHMGGVTTMISKYAILIIVVVVWMSLCIKKTNAMNRNIIVNKVENSVDYRDLELRWLPDGEHLFIGARWLFRLKDGRLSEITPSFCSAVDEDNHYMCKDVIFSSSGKAFVVKDNVLKIGRMEGPVELEIAIPGLVRSDMLEIFPSSIAFWLAGDNIFVKQIDDPLRPKCRMFEVKTKKWHQMPSCPEGNHCNIRSILLGSNGLLAVYSGGENQSSVSFFHYHDKKFVPIGARSIPLHLTSSIRFTPDARSIEIVTACRLKIGESKLELDGGCNKRSKSRNLYSMTVDGKSLRLIRSNLPPGTVLNSQNDYYAWPRGAEICVGDLHRSAYYKCFQLPQKK